MKHTFAKKSLSVLLSLLMLMSVIGGMSLTASAVDGWQIAAHQTGDAYGTPVITVEDGAVSMELQGTEEQIDGVILAIERGAYVQIENMYVKTLPPLDGEYGFTVKDDD